jgi:type IV secretion system protein VirB9
MISKLLLVTILVFLSLSVLADSSGWESLNVPPLVDNGYTSRDETIKKHHQQSATEYDVASGAINESLKWQAGKVQPPILSGDGVVRFPYGAYQPVVTCKPLNLCDIELQAGEEIQGILIGDSIRWNEGDNGIPVVYSGEATKLIPHLVLKPSQSGLETTLMVTTSKRTYMIKLHSASYGYVERAGFYYPHQDDINYQLSAKQIRDKAAVNNPATIINQLHDGSKKLNYAYSVEDKLYDWKPLEVFDDGISVFIKMPAKVSAKDLPSICVISVNDNSQCELVNFRYLESYYIIDKLFSRAKLVNGFGRNAETITITSNDASNNVIKRRFWSRIFGG